MYLSGWQKAILIIGGLIYLDILRFYYFRVITGSFAGAPIVPELIKLILFLGWYPLYFYFMIIRTKQAIGDQVALTKKELAGIKQRREAFESQIVDNKENVQQTQAALSVESQKLVKEIIPSAQKDLSDFEGHYLFSVPKVREKDAGYHAYLYELIETDQVATIGEAIKIAEDRYAVYEVGAKIINKMDEIGQQIMAKIDQHSAAVTSAIEASSQQITASMDRNTSAMVASINAVESSTRALNSQMTVVSSQIIQIDRNAQNIRGYR